MSIATVPSIFPPFSPPPQPVRWTVDEFHRLCSDPDFEQRRLILIAGNLLEMPIPNPPHNAALSLVDDALRAAFGAGHCFRGQMPLVLNQTTDPMPDIAVIRGSPRDFATVHPRSAILVVEISESTLAYDLGEKANVYAAGGITEYWVVDLVHRKLVVHRQPAAATGEPHGAKYQSVSDLGLSASVSPLAAPQASIAVQDLLP